MKYSIQQNFYRPESLESLLKVLEITEREYEIIPVYYNKPIESIFSKDRKVFVFGGLYMSEKILKFDWNPGSLMNDQHNFMYYKDIYKEHLLNYNSKIITFNEPFDWYYPELFIRPTKDSKLFNAKVFTKEEWLDLQQSITLKEYTDSKELIQIIKPKKIHKEIRFWIVGGEIVDTCVYKINGIGNFSKEVENEAYDFVEDMLKFPTIASSFVMDICLINEGYKIVELNCINASAFYLCDVFKLIEKIENFY